MADDCYRAEGGVIVEAVAMTNWQLPTCSISFWNCKSHRNSLRIGSRIMANPNNTKCLDGKFTHACLQNNTNSRWRGSEVKSTKSQKIKIRKLVRLKMRETARCSEDALAQKKKGRD